MRTQGLSLFMWLGVLSLGCGDDGGAGGTETESGGSETGATGGMTTTPMMTTASMTTASMDEGTTTDMPPGEGTSTGEPPADDSGTVGATDTGDGSGTEGATETGDGTTGGGGSEYPGCMPDADPVCPEPYTGCYPFAPKDFSVCTVDGCQDPDDCPQPASGDAPVVCGGMQMDLCVLDCSDGQMCPIGMMCIEVVQGISRCMQPNP